MSAAASNWAPAGPSGTESSLQPAVARVAIAIGQVKLRQMVLDAVQPSTVEIVEENCPVASLSDLLGTVARLRPDILLLGLPGLSFDPAAALASIAALDPAPRVIAVSDSADPEIILKVMRAGAVEFVYPPLSSCLDEALRRIAAVCLRDPDEGRAMGSVIGFVSAKGGCGATTLACHAAAHLRRSAKKQVLLADLDMSAGIAGTLMQSASRYSLDDAFQHLHRMDLKLWTALVGQSPSGVDILPAAPEPSANTLSASRKLPQMLRFWRTHYELTILDLGHGMNQVVIDALESIDTIVLVTTDELPALRQARHLMQCFAARNVGANRVRLVINRMPKRAQIRLTELEKVMGHPIFFPLPDDYQALNEAYAESRLMSPDSDLASRIGSFAEKLTGVTPAAKKSRGLFQFRKGV